MLTLNLTTTTPAAANLPAGSFVSFVFGDSK